VFGWRVRRGRECLDGGLGGEGREGRVYFSCLSYGHYKMIL